MSTPPPPADDYVYAVAAAERAARDAYAAPPPGRDPLDHALEVQRIELVRAGLLAPAPGRPSAYEITQAAEFLIRHAASRRYAGPDGVARLLQSPENINHAYKAAMDKSDPRESVRTALADSRDLLLMSQKPDSAGL